VESWRKTLGNSWPNTWNSDAFVNALSKRFSGMTIAKKSWWRTSNTERERAIVTNFLD
jgi:hypothetical protein